MLSDSDREKLKEAQQAVDLAGKSLTELYKADDQLLAEHAFELIETMAKINNKVSKAKGVSIMPLSAGEEIADCMVRKSLIACAVPPGICFSLA